MYEIGMYLLKKIIYVIEKKIVKWVSFEYYLFFYGE